MSASVAGLAASRALHRAFWFYRAYRVEKALLDLRDAVERKYGYDRNQPRVPAGNPHGGEWTDGGGGSGAGRSSDEGRIRVAQNDDPNRLTDVQPRPRNLPRSIQSLSDIPKEKPSSTKRENAFVKFLAHRITEIIALQSLRARVREDVVRRVRRALIAAQLATWITEKSLHSIVSYYDPPKSLEELQDAVSYPRPGTQVHHIVERNSEQPGEKTRIYSRENEVRIPEFKHHEITAWYMKTNEDFEGLSPRQYLRDKDWATRRQVGLSVLVDKGVMKP